MTSLNGDEAVQNTNDDASLCKRFAVQLGYWSDPFIAHFVRSGERRTPEINRGYYARVTGLKLLINQFLRKTDGQCQVVNLGAGFDTLYWRLREEGASVCNFIELDFPSVTARKSLHIKRNRPLLERVHREDGEVRFSASDLHGSAYHLVGVDLRDRDEVERKLRESDVNFTLPTLFIAECVLVYMETTHTKTLLEWAASTFQTALFLNYEQVNMRDRFGDVMLGNLSSRGCGLPGVAACTSLETQKQRFLSTGWEGARAWDMVEVYSSLPPEDVARVEKLEFLDEQELLQQLFQHYCICIAWKDGAALQLQEIDFG